MTPSPSLFVNSRLHPLLLALPAALLLHSACAAAPAASPLSPVARHGRLQVQGNRLVDAHGQPVQLRGMSLFWSQWMGQYYNPEAIRWLRDDWHCTVVRAAMGVGSGGYLSHPEQERQKVVTVIDAAIKLGIYVIIDWHDHNAQQNTAAAQKFFGEMAERYKGAPNVLYEIYNEPLDNASWANDIKLYSEAVIGTIRQHDPNGIVICGTRTWSQRVDEAAQDPIAGKNIAYTLHFYAGTHKQGLRDIAATALRKGVALFVTECGTTEASGNGPVNTAETQKWWQFLDDNHISWCCWSVADKQETSAALQPGARATGGWADSALTPSGLFVRDELRRRAQDAP